MAWTRSRAGRSTARTLDKEVTVRAMAYRVGRKLGEAKHSVFGAVGNLPLLQYAA